MTDTMSTPRYGALVALDEEPQQDRDQPSRASTTSGTRSWPDALRSRRTILKGAVAAGAAVGLHVLGLLPPIKKAWGVQGYEIWINNALQPGGNACPPASTFTGTAKCTVGCGPSMIYSDACKDVYNDPPVGNNWYHYHKTDGGTNWALRPDECFTNPYTGDKYDGWYWRFEGACGFCPNYVVYRCHDGKKRVSGLLRNSICKYAVSCA